MSTPFLSVFMRVCGLLAENPKNGFTVDVQSKIRSESPTSGASTWFFRSEVPHFCVLRLFSPPTNV